MATNVVGLFDDRDSAQGAVTDLIDAGFNRSDISIVAADPEGSMYKQHVDDEGNIAGEGAATGLTSGAVVGGLLGLLIGAGLIFVPAGVLAAGPIVGLLAGGAAGAATGGILGGLIGLGIPAEDADVYAESIRRGGTLLTVHADDANASRAHAILDRDGAVDIQDRAERYRAEGFTGYDKDAPAYSADQAQAERDRLRTSDTALSTTEPARVRTYGGASLTGTPYADNPSTANAMNPSALGATAGDSNYGNPSFAASQTPTGVPNDLPGVQTGGHAIDGTADTRGITEKAADAVTGDNYDDKTGKRVD